MWKKFKVYSVLICIFIFKSAAAEPLRVILDWYFNPDHAPLFVAESEGYFKDEGLKVEFIQPSDTADGPKLVAARQADLAITYQPGFMRQVDMGLPLMRVGSLIDKPLESLVVLQDGPIHSIAQLKGKTIGYSNPAADELMLEVMLQHNGLTLQDVQTVNVRFSLLQALISKNIGAMTGAMRNVEPILLEMSGKKGHLFYPEDNGFPPYDELIFITHTKHCNDPRLPHFFKALKKAVVYLRAHPQESWAKFQKKYPEKGEMSHRTWFVSLPYFSDDPAAVDTKKYNNLMLFLYQKGFLSRSIPLSQYVYAVGAKDFRP